MDIQDILAKIVDAAQSDVATQLGSLEETVLTLAEALLRPGGRPEVRPEVRIQERVEFRPVPGPEGRCRGLATVGSVGPLGLSELPGLSEQRAAAAAGSWGVTGRATGTAPVAWELW